MLEKGLKQKHRDQWCTHASGGGEDRKDTWEEELEEFKSQEGDGGMERS